MLATGLVLVAVLVIVGSVGIERALSAPSEVRPAGNGVVAAAAKPTPPAPWKVVSSASTVAVGQTFTIQARVGATGGRNGFRVQIDHVGKYADIVGCSPDCSTSRDPENISATFGSSAAASTSVTIQMVARRSGQSRWTVCFYDIADTSNQLYCRDLITTFR